jgi:hypothetical protein
MSDFHFLESLKVQILNGRSVMYLETDGLEEWRNTLTNIHSDLCQKLFLEGSLSMNGWNKSWQQIHSYRNDLQNMVLAQQQNLVHLQADIDEYQRKLEETRKKFSGVKEKLDLLQTQLQTCAVLDQSFAPLSEAQRNVKQDFLAKIHADDFEVSSMSTHDVIVFLNLSGVSELIPWFEREKITGDGLEFIGEKEFLDQKISLNVRLLYFYHFSMLQHRLFLNKEHLKKCPVCKVRTPEEHSAFSRQWNIDLAAFDLSPRLLVRFKKHHLNILNIPANQRGALWKIIQEIRQAHDSVISQ